MRKFILYASMAFILSFYSVANIEAGSEGFTIEIDSDDLCAGGAVECTYLFTAKSGSNKQITMARRLVGTESSHNAGNHDNHGDDYRSTDWHYYDLPIKTKSQVQAGYNLESDGDLVLIMVYSADGEDKGGAIVSRISKDYGETWIESVNITDNQKIFGLAVAPNSSYVAISDLKRYIALHKIAWNINNTWTGWFKEDNDLNLSHQNKQGSNNTYGLSVIYDDTLANPLVSVAFVDCQKKLKIRSYSTSASNWTDNRPNEDGYNNDTAWLYNREVDDTGTLSSIHYLAVKRSYVGVRTTSDLTAYSTFDNWTDQGKFPVSGIWRCPDTDTNYILSTDNQKIFGIYEVEQKKVLYESNQNSSFQRRVSMFNVPEK